MIQLNAKVWQSDNETRRSRAMVHIEGLRELNQRANKQKADALDVCEEMAASADGATMELIEQHLDEHEIAIGMEDIATSPFRVDGPIARLRTMYEGAEAEDGDGEESPNQL